MTACGGGQGGDAADGWPDPGTSAAGDSAEARAVIEEVQKTFVVRPDVQPLDLGPKPLEAASPLPPSEVDGFTRGDGVLLPRLRDGDGAAIPGSRVRIGERASSGFQLESARGSMTLRVRPEGASAAPAELGHGFVVFRDGLGGGTDVIHRASADGLEDFVRFEEKPAAEAMVYDVELAGVEGLRLVANTLEMLDEGGAPRMRVSPPSVVDADGTWHWASLSIEGCAVDTSPAAPWGRPTTPPGAPQCRLRVDWSGQDVVYPALVDPNFWTNTGSLGTGRAAHVAARITGDKVLVAGGVNASGVALSSAELWDLGSGTWSATGSMAYTRFFFAGVATSSSATTILVAGGQSSTCLTNPCNRSEKYDTASGTFGSAVTMVAGRASLAMALLSSGTQILVSGGADSSGTALPSAELYTISTNAWAATGNMTNGRYAHTLTALAGSVAALAAGGRTATTILAAAEKWSGGSWSGAGTHIARSDHTASLLSGDHVLIAGGMTATNGGCITRPQKWTSPTTWATAGSMTGGTTRCFHSAATLSDGTVLVEGGLTAGSGGTYMTTATLYDPSANTWSAMPDMGTARALHTSSLFNTVAPSKVLVAGGQNSGGKLSACEFFTH